MARFPQPFFRAPRQLWYVQIGKKQHNLGPDKDAAFAEYHRLMSQPQVAIDPTLVVKILDGFLTWEKGQRAARTYEGHRWHIQRFIDAVPGIATLTVADLKPHHVKSWADSRMSRRPARQMGRPTGDARGDFERLQWSSWVPSVDVVRLVMILIRPPWATRRARSGHGAQTGRPVTGHGASRGNDDDRATMGLENAT